MKLRANKNTDILDKPGGSKVDDLIQNEDVVVTGKKDGLFSEIDLETGEPPRWVLTADLGAPAQLPQFDRRIFVEECINVERLTNSLAATLPFLVSADFLLARGLIETNLQSAGEKIAGSDATGPLQMSSDEWKTFLQKGGELKEGFSLGDADQPIKQIRGAAYRMFADSKAISDIKLAKGVGTQAEPFFPSNLDIFNAYLTNSAAGAVAVLDAFNKDEDRNKPVSQVLKGPLTDDQITALFKARGQYTGASDKPKSVAEFMKGNEATLNKALEDAFGLMKQFAPDELLPEAQDISNFEDVAAVPPNDPVPFSVLKDVANCFWPVITADPQAMVVSYKTTLGPVVGREARRFFADRSNGTRHHVGIDVFCKEGDVVVACADGEIVKFFKFYTRPSTGEETFALFLEHDGVVINYGEVRSNAPTEFGWQIGKRVKAGDPIAKVSGTDMIHFESYEFGTRENFRWMVGEARPPKLRNSTKLLLALAAAGKRKNVDGSVTTKPKPKTGLSKAEAPITGDTFEKKAVGIMSRLIADIPMGKIAAAGILGNLGRETGGFKFHHQIGSAPNQGGIGWAQWTGIRRTQYEQFCANKGLDVKSDEGNYAFLKHELLETPEKNVLKNLRTAPTLAKAVEVFVSEYERAGVVALDDRIQFGQRALKAFDAQSG
jgi:murein DD-endopeptidase MepM/ murein hydrolase activator NlpD